MKTEKGMQKGFSLLEVIVALAILGICVTVILQIMSSVTTATSVTDDYAKALSIAETRMAMLVAQDSPTSSDTGKLDGGFRWRSQVMEYRPPNDNRLFNNPGFTDPDNIYRPYHYKVVVTWGGYRKRQFELSTIRLGVTQ